jgi:hypothetical protein
VALNTIKASKAKQILEPKITSKVYLILLTTSSGNVSIPSFFTPDF